MKILRDKEYKYMLDRITYQNNKIGSLRQDIQTYKECIFHEQEYTKEILTKLDNTKKELHETKEELKSVYGRLGGVTKALNRYKKVS